MSAVPGPVYGLEVPPGEILIPATMEFPASFRITMAAVDPTEEPEADGEGNIPTVPRSTLRLALLAGSDDEEDSDEEANGGPSDPVKAKKQRQAAAIKKLLDEEGADLENFVICTLDTERNYQQPLDITVNHGEKLEYALEGEESDESDELDGVQDPRVQEIESDEEEAPKLVSVQKGKNKRAAEEATEGLDELISKDDAKLSKKQQKKLKNNKGEAVATEEKKDAKKVQFAKNLEQGPTGSAEKAKQGKATTGVKVVQGVTIDDRTIGNGRTVKNGDTVGVRYIGKLQNGKQFDANKKGKPFSFKAGKGQVIKGWDIGVIGMAIGGERRLTIPRSSCLRLPWPSWHSRQ
ncbi:hypothetical protein RAB80_000888 [Fusarium oxysporum f. sp. vasinfectum]|nr:hypothetical protein RAB80_000888 [Fusarium oxysporum f. sp. vasinfectum]